MTSRWRAQGKQVLQDDRHFADAAGELEAMMIVNAMRALDSRSSGGPDLADAVAYGFDSARPGSDKSAEVEYRGGKIVSVRNVPVGEMTHETVHPRIGNVVRDAVRRNRPILNLNTCRVMRQGDEMACPCGLRWAVDDPEPPRCVHRT